MLVISTVLFNLCLFHDEKSQNFCVMNSHLKTAVVQACGDTFLAVYLPSLTKISIEMKNAAESKGFNDCAFSEVRKKCLPSHLGQCIVTEVGSFIIAKNQNYHQATTNISN